jgi:hypothetical protein
VKRLFKNYGLSVALAALFLVSWGLQTYTGWKHFKAENQQHGQKAQVFGDDGYIWDWGEATFENWQSEFLQLLAFVILSTYLIHRHSPQSRDSEDEMMEKIDRIERMLARERSTLRSA